MRKYFQVGDGVFAGDETSGMSIRPSSETNEIKEIHKSLYDDLMNKIAQYIQKINNENLQTAKSPIANTNLETLTAKAELKRLLPSASNELIDLLLG
jgi:hypothetical protein